jgi:membrane-associated phospholipid phosphatase
METKTKIEEPGAVSRPIGERLPTIHPIAAATIVAIAGVVVLSAILVAIGLTITSSPFSGAIGAWDVAREQWFAAHRTALLNTLTNVGSIFAGAGTILLVGGIAAGILAIRRSWYDVGFLLTALSVEFLVFLSASTVVDRPRPTATIRPLDPLPVTSSFPSGHVAAAIALYVGLAIVISSHTRRLAVRIPVWIVAIAAPTWVGIARVYRGMHHPTDVMASVVLGAGELCVAFLTVRCAAVVVERRHRLRDGDRPIPIPATVRV